MSYRVLLLIPEGLTFDQLTPEQQAAINSIFGNYRMPMPGTVPVNGLDICDAVTAPNFKPETMGDFGLTWEIIGMWSDDGTAIVPLSETKYLERLAPVSTYDEDGAIVSTEPAQLYEPHRWAGWPMVIGNAI